MGQAKSVSLREVGRMLGIPPSTIVYYKDKFKNYIPEAQGSGRRRRYPVQVVDIFRRIREMYNGNWSTEDIEREIAQQFKYMNVDQSVGQSVDQSGFDRAGTTPGGLGGAGGLGLETLVARLADSLQNQALFQSEIGSLRDEVDKLRRERSDERRTFREKLETMESEISRLRRELSKRKDAGAGIDFPPAAYLDQPLVIGSNGRYLGVQGQDNAFSLKDFIGMIESNASGQTVVETSWHRSGENWVLVVRTEDTESGREQSIVMVTARVKTPKQNEVTEIVRLTINGKEAPDALLLSLFRQVRSVFGR